MYRPAMGNDDVRGLRLGALVFAISAVCAAGILIASARVPSPAHESRFVVAGGRVLQDPAYCSGILLIDGEVAWSMCHGGYGESATYLGRFSAPDGTWTLLPLPPDAEGLEGAVAGPSSERVFVIGNQLVDVQGSAIRAIGRTLLPLGLARVGEGVELVDRMGSGGVAVSRFVRGERVSRREVTIAVPAREGRAVQPASAYFDDARWHLLVEEYAQKVASLPLDVTLYAQEESGSPRVLGVVALDTSNVMPLDDGTVIFLPTWLIAGSLGLGHIAQTELYVLGASGLERVHFDGSPSLNIIGRTLSDRAHQPAIIAAEGERELRVGASGLRVERVRVRERFDALRMNRHTSQPLVASFHLDAGFRLLPMRQGGYVLLGAQGQAYVRVGRDLERADALTIPQRLMRLFVKDRAKRNSGYTGVYGFLRVATVPWMLLGLPVGIAVLLLRRRYPRLVVALGATWLVVAAAGAWHFVYVLRYFW